MTLQTRTLHEPVGASLLANRADFSASPFASKLAPTKAPFALEAQP